MVVQSRSKGKEYVVESAWNLEVGFEGEVRSGVAWMLGKQLHTWREDGERALFLETRTHECLGRQWRNTKRGITWSGHGERERLILAAGI